MSKTRIAREHETISVMIGMYCRHRHQSNGYLCDDCLHLDEYSDKRIQNCRFGDQKPVCTKCPVHCYKPEMREQIREVMRYSGPRMIKDHPYLAIMHIIDKNRFKQNMSKHE
jgi:hypothetical protein